MPLVDVCRSFLILHQFSRHFKFLYYARIRRVKFSQYLTCLCDKRKTCVVLATACNDRVSVMLVVWPLKGPRNTLNLYHNFQSSDIVTIMNDNKEQHIVWFWYNTETVSDSLQRQLVQEDVDAVCSKNNQPCRYLKKHHSALSREVFYWVYLKVFVPQTLSGRSKICVGLFSLMTGCW